MPKLTKTQKKRLISEIMSKTSKLYMFSHTDMAGHPEHIVSTKDIEAVERLTSKWLKRLG